MGKKIEVVSFRTDSETKEKLQVISEKRDITISKLINKIVEAYLEQEA